MVIQMTQAKTQVPPDMPVFSENRAITDANKARRAIRAMWDELGTLRAVSAKIGFGSGYLSLVLNDKRPASKELLIALGLRKPPRPPLTPAERAARKQTREITHELWQLHTAAHAGYTVSMTRVTEPVFAWAITIQHPSYDAIQAVDTSFIDAVRRANHTRFTRMVNDKTN